MFKLFQESEAIFREDFEKQKPRYEEIAIENVLTQILRLISSETFEALEDVEDNAAEFDKHADEELERMKDVVKVFPNEILDFLETGKELPAYIPMYMKSFLEKFLDITSKIETPGLKEKLQERFKQSIRDYLKGGDEGYLT